MLKIWNYARLAVFAALTTGAVSSPAFAAKKDNTVRFAYDQVLLQFLFYSPLEYQRKYLCHLKMETTHHYH